MQSINAADIDEYIAAFPSNVQKLLQQVRSTIKKAVPNAKETIKYAIPTFTLEKNLIHFAAYTNHIGLYPAPRGIKEFEKELAVYAGGKGTAQFPLDKPLPLDLITRIAKYQKARLESRLIAPKKKRAKKKK
jgi:uncharacterized protein YdhG (YjbR/CyaY superfamily)